MLISYNVMVTNQQHTTYRVNGLHGICWCSQACCFILQTLLKWLFLYVIYFLFSKSREESIVMPPSRRLKIQQDVIAIIFIIMIQRPLVLYYFLHPLNSFIICYCIPNMNTLNDSIVVKLILFFYFFSVLNIYLFLNA
jgi:hypothetical protein